MLKVLYYTIKKDIKLLFRRRQIIFWGFIFPLMLIFVFSKLIKPGAQKDSLLIVNKDHGNMSKMLLKALNKSNLFDIKFCKNLSEGLKEQKEQGYPVLVYIPANFTKNFMSMDHPEVILYTRSLEKNGFYSMQVITEVQGVLNAVNREISYQIIKTEISKYVPMNNSYARRFFLFLINPIKVKIAHIETKKHKSSSFIKKIAYQYTVFAMLAANILLIGLAVSVVVIGYEIDRRTIRRFTKSRKLLANFLLSKLLACLIIFLISMLVVLAVCRFVYGIVFTVPLYYPIILYIIAALPIFVIGFYFPIVFKSTEKAQSIATIVALFLCFTMGLFIPLPLLPKILQKFSTYFPPSVVLLLTLKSMVSSSVISLTYVKNVELVIGCLGSTLALMALLIYILPKLNF